jgi:hypothetical protein
LIVKLVTGADAARQKPLRDELTVGLRPQRNGRSVILFAVRFGVVLMPLLLFGAALALVAAAPASAHTPGAYWPAAKTMRGIDDARVRVGGTVVELDNATTLCSGLGRARRRQGVRAWSHFHCTFTAFRRGVPWRDLEFRVHALDSRRFTITSPRWIVD